MRHIALAFVILSGCTIEYHQGGYISPEERAFEEKALPVLQQACSSCHGNPAWPESFIVGDTPAEMRQSMLASDVVDIDNPVTSRIFTKGLHTGPAFTASQASDILQWLTIERDAAQSP